MATTMRTPVPIYRERCQTFHADACRPVAEAVAAGTIHYRALARGQYPGSRFPAAVLPGMRTLGFWDISDRQKWGLCLHRNEGIEITYVERGRLPFALERRDYLLQPGDLTFTRPWQPHSLGDPNVPPSRLHWVILDVGVRKPHQPWHWPPWVVLTPKDRNELTTMLRQAVGPVWHAGDEMRACFQRIAAAVEADRQGSNASRLTAYLNELLVLLLELLRQGGIPFDESLATAHHTVELFWEEMRQNVAMLARPWSVAEMARYCGMGVTQFTRLCRQLANMTPMEYLSHQRIHAAQRILLEQPQKPVTEVGFVCGFGSSQYFAKVFRQVIRCSPSQFRQVDNEPSGNSPRTAR